jgi:hypothetical protein
MNLVWLSAAPHSDGVPALRVDGNTKPALPYLKDHLNYLPVSGSVLGQLADQLGGYTMTKSCLHFRVDRPLPKALVNKLVVVRIGTRASRTLGAHGRHAMVGVHHGPAGCRFRKMRHAAEPGPQAYAIPRRSRSRSQGAGCLLVWCSAVDVAVATH